MLVRESVIEHPDSNPSLNKTNHSKAKKTHGFHSYILLSVYPLDILSIKTATEYHNN